MLSKLRLNVIAFIKSTKEVPVLAAFASGLYPLLHYYNTNFTLVNSWEHLGYFVCVYLVFPIVIFVSLNRFLRNFIGFSKLKPYLLSVLNMTCFSLLLLLSTYGFELIQTSVVFLVALALGILLRKHLKKIIVFQLLLSTIVVVKLVPDLYKHLTYSSEWMLQNDAIDSVMFKRKPNVYIIQPDGYANFLELKNANYNFDNSLFESFLQHNDFKLYEGFRSNYTTTLSSNTSMFAMKHHYYNSPKPTSNELYKSRTMIVGENAVTSIFKNNDYKTFLILEKPYLLINRPKLAYDFCNINYGDIPYLSRGFDIEKDVMSDLELAIKNNNESNNFYFIEKLSPGHITVNNGNSKGKEQERLNYLNKLDAANKWLTKMITTIESHDDNSLIVIVADHGGFVGLDYSLQARQKQKKDNLVTTVFSSALAIKWPSDASEFDSRLKSNVNLFRVLFAYLSENKKYLNELEDDKSFSIIEKDAPFGVYEVIDEDGNVVFENLTEE